MKKISVIVPVFNTEPNYIKEAVDSVLNQTYKNIEIIIVDDGSTNKETLDYLESFNHSSVKIVHQENKGLGGARNTGIDNATGEYIGFLDSDDWVDLNFYEILYKLCEENEADIACGTLTRTSLKRKKLMDKFKNCVVDDFAKKMKYITNGSVCSKLFNKNLFSNIRFQEHLYYEDNPVLIETIDKSNKVAFTNTVKYYYRVNENSICLDAQKAQKRLMDKLEILKLICDIIKNKTQKEKDIVLYRFTLHLIEGVAYSYDKEYQAKINDLLGVNYKKYLYQTETSFVENIFSLKNCLDRNCKIITILGIKFKSKRKPKIDAK